MVEEFFYAAVQLKQYDWAEVFLKIIRHFHPQSVKSMRLLGVFYESQLSIEKALNIYHELME